MEKIKCLINAHVFTFFLKWIKLIEIRRNEKKKKKEIGSRCYVLRLPSVTTWMQSSFLVVMGHLQSAPERLVPGCKFWSSGAPTSNLFFFFWKNKKKKRIKVKWKPWGGSYIIRIWQSLHCAQFYVNIRMYPSIHRGATRKKKKAHAWKGKVWIITLADKHTSAKKKKKKKNRKKYCHS